MELTTRDGKQLVDMRNSLPGPMFTIEGTRWGFDWALEATLLELHPLPAGEMIRSWGKIVNPPQVMLATGAHYPKIEGLRAAARRYRDTCGSNYFDDLFRAHRALGLAWEKDGVRVLVSLTPFKYNEVAVFSEGLSLPFKNRVYDVLAWLRDKAEMETFNLGLVTPPLAPSPESWEGFPVLARVVDRGDLRETFSDIGGVEVFAATVVASDPFRLAQRMAESFGEVADG